MSSLVIAVFTKSTIPLHLSAALAIALWTMLQLSMAAPVRSSRQSSLYWFKPITKRPPPAFIPSSVLLRHTDSSKYPGSDIILLENTKELMEQNSSSICSICIGISNCKMHATLLRNISVKSTIFYLFKLNNILVTYIKIGTLSCGTYLFIKY